ncbi:MAG: hypothetical protein J0H68_03835 [Sphingobacteriia bacterium]|nr:hypothetical protein [Sphingobacteriia bacterium]
MKFNVRLDNASMRTSGSNAPLWMIDLSRDFGITKPADKIKLEVLDVAGNIVTSGMDYGVGSIAKIRINKQTSPEVIKAFVRALAQQNNLPISAAEINAANYEALKGLEMEVSRDGMILAANGAGIAKIIQGAGINKPEVVEILNPAPVVVAPVVNPVVNNNNVQPRVVQEVNWGEADVDGLADLFNEVVAPAQNNSKIKTAAKVGAGLGLGAAAVYAANEVDNRKFNGAGKKYVSEKIAQAASYLDGLLGGRIGQLLGNGQNNNNVQANPIVNGVENNNNLRKSVELQQSQVQAQGNQQGM